MQRWKTCSHHLLKIVTPQTKVKIFFSGKALSQGTCFTHMPPLCCSVYTECNDRAKCHYINLFLYLYRDNIMVNNQPFLSQLLKVPYSQKGPVSDSFSGPPMLDLFCCIWLIFDEFGLWQWTAVKHCVEIRPTMSLFYTFCDTWMIYNFFLSSRRLFDAVPNCPGQ